MAGAVTLTLMVQLPLAGTVAFDTDIDPDPAVAVIVGDPHPEEEALAGLVEGRRCDAIARAEPGPEPVPTR